CNSTPVDPAVMFVCQASRGRLPLSRFAIGVAAVAFGFSSGFILNDARDLIFCGLLTRFNLGSRGGIGCCLKCGGLSVNARLLLELDPFALRTPLFSRRGDCQPLFLPCEPGGFGGFLCGTMRFEASSLGVGSGAAAIREIITSVVFQISVPSEVSATMRPIMAN
ncbi:MAG: hypothetical protein KKB37_13470, partial [Alphaproteobacteria bacterium]|nr:hypothetical protein [Alphaproteobacteria bacterium]